MRALTNSPSSTTSSLPHLLGVSLRDTSLLPRTQKLIEKYGTREITVFQERLLRQKNYPCVIDLLGKMKNSELSPEQTEFRTSLVNRLLPFDTKRFIPDEVTLEKQATIKKYQIEDFITDLQYALTLPNLKEIIVPIHWLHTEDTNVQTLLSNLIQKQVAVKFGNISPEMLASKKHSGSSSEFLPSKKHSKPVAFYFAETFVPEWWERAYFMKETSKYTRETLVEQVKEHLADRNIDESLWKSFLKTAQDYQIAALLYKDDYYLGQLDQGAKSYKLETIQHLSRILSDPSKVKGLVLTPDFELPAEHNCIGIRSLKLASIKTDLKRLTHFIHLQKLTINSLNIQESLNDLPLLPKLKSFTLERGSLKNEDFSKICDLPKLEMLDLKECRFHSEVEFSHLLKLKHLRNLLLPENCLFTEDSHKQECLTLLIQKGVQIYFNNHSISQLDSLSPNAKIGFSHPYPLPDWCLKRKSLSTSEAKKISQNVEQHILENVANSANCKSYMSAAQRFEMPRLLYAAKYYAETPPEVDEEGELLIAKDLLNTLTFCPARIKRLEELVIHLLRLSPFEDLGTLLYKNQLSHLRTTGVLRMLQEQENKQLRGTLTTPYPKYTITLDPIVAALSSGFFLEEFKALKPGHPSPTFACTGSLAALTWLEHLIISKDMDFSGWEKLKKNPAERKRFILEEKYTPPEFYPFLAELWTLAKKLKIVDLEASINAFLVKNKATTHQELNDLCNSFPLQAHISLDVGDLDEQAFDSLSNFEKLVFLNLHKAQTIDLEALSNFISNSSHLQSLTISHCAATINLAPIFSDLATYSKALNSLSLYHFSARNRENELSTNDIKLLASIQSLKEIDLRDCKLAENADLKPFLAMPNLKSLKIDRPYKESAAQRKCFDELIRRGIVKEVHIKQ